MIEGFDGLTASGRILMSPSKSTPSQTVLSRSQTMHFFNGDVQAPRN